jgi:poly [ADP-ribose] polymerase
MGRKIELINVSDINNNKFYYMEELGDGTWLATWGRIGVTASTKNYPMKQWESKYNEKLRKGYKDITSLRVDKVATSFKDMTDPQIKELLDSLQRYSKQHIAETYTVSSNEVTMLQIDEAQRIIDDLSLNIDNMNGFEINSRLIKLYTVVPRRMKKTQYHLIETSVDTTVQRTEAKKFITQEQDNIDVMRQQVSMQQSSGTSGEVRTIEDALGIKVEHITPEDMETIKKMMGSDVHKFKKAFKVVNHNTQSKFENKKTRSHKPWSKLLWHGSKNENWLNILKTGLLIRPSGIVLTGAMFGNGIYFANKASKSIGYTSLRGSYWASGSDNRAFLAIYEVNSGMEYRTKNRESWMSSCSHSTLQSKGQYDSLFCEGGIDLRNDELIIYDADQCSVKYLIEIG